MSDKMRAIILEKYDSNIVNAIRNLKVVEKNIPQPKSNELLIQIEAAPCNPSDIAFLRGMYNIVKPLPSTLGFEGSGLVVDAGDSPEAKKLLGKRVSCFTQDNNDGTWAEYFITKPENCIVLKDQMDIDQAACLFINPFTAYALYEHINKYKADAFIQNAATGQIGKFLRILANKQNIPSINMVRKQEHIELLQNEGEEYVINVAEPDFENKLAEYSRKLNATIAFDAVGGDITGSIINKMPDGSTVFVYGGLSGLPVGNIDVLPLIFKKKTIKGFNLNDYNEITSRKHFDEVADKLQDYIIKGEMSTSIQRSIRLEDISRGMILYISRMSNGKILLKPQEK